MAKVELGLSAISLALLATILYIIRMKPRKPKRPEWQQVYLDTAGGYVLCWCNDILTTTQAVFLHWQMGHFDR